MIISVIVYIVHLLVFAENYFVLKLIGIYCKWRTEAVKRLKINTLKRSNGYSSTVYPTFLVSPAIPVTWYKQLYIPHSTQISLYCSVLQRRITHFKCYTGFPLHVGEWSVLSIHSSSSSSGRSLVRARWGRHQQSSYQNGMSAEEVCG
jgi:hypothetical protein